MIGHFTSNRSLSVFLLIINLVGLGLLGGGYYYLEQESGVLAAAQSAIAARETERRDLGQLQRIMAATATERETLDQYFISPRTLPLFLEQLDNWSVASQVNLNVSNAEMTNGNTPQLKLAFTLNGSFAGIYRFLSLIDQAPVRVRWTAADLSRGAAAAEKGPPLNLGASWQGNFGLEVLSFRSDQ